MFEKRYDGAHYAAIGDFLRENYLQEGFAQGTVQEVDFLVGALELSPNARILDVGCGAGRHVLEFARRGFRPLGVDLSGGLIEVARDLAASEGLAAEFVVEDARELAFSREFDAAVCLCQGAFGIAGDEAGHRRILEGVARALRPDAPFVLTAINALSVLRRDDAGGEHFDPYTLTSLLASTFYSPEGETLHADVHVTAFTYRELKWLLEAAGFEVVAAYGCVAGSFERKPLTLQDVEIMMVAKRR